MASCRSELGVVSASWRGINRRRDGDRLKGASWRGINWRRDGDRLKLETGFASAVLDVVPESYPETLRVTSPLDDFNVEDEFRLAELDLIATKVGER